MMTAVFLIVAVIGVVILLATLLLDDVIDGLVPDLPWIDGPVVGAFLAAFGIIGWSVDAASDTTSWLAAGVGLVGGVALGYGTYRLSKALWNLPTDATPTTESLLGLEGRVVTPIAADGLGEVVVTLGGQPVKLSAKAGADALERGANIVVVDVESSTRVVVQGAEEFWGE